MNNPLNPPIVVPFGGKTYDCDLTLGSLPAVEGELGIGILCPDAASLWTKPEFYQRTVILYCLMKSTKASGVTFDRCAAEVVGPNAERLADAIGVAVLRLKPEIMRINGIKPLEAAEDRPLADPSSGQESGLSEGSSCVSQTEISGDLPLDNS